jgi:hypothetical protein
LGYFYFQHLYLCTWDNDGTQPAAPEKVNCWDTFTFNNSTCTWDNDGTAKPTEPTKSELGYFYFSTIQPVLGIMMEQPERIKKLLGNDVQLNLLSNNKSELLGYLLSTILLVRDNDGTAKPNEPKK